MRKALMATLLCVLLSGAFALSGYGTSAPVANDTVNPTLLILSPNGGESWYIGDTNDVLWTASDPNLVNNSVNLWYSLNGGTDYTLIAEGTFNDGTEPWFMPSIQSYSARVKIGVSDSFGNSTLKNSASSFSITYVPPAEPTGLNVDISNNVDAVLNWQAVTHTIPPYNGDITPDGYIVLYNETPYEDEQFYYFLTETNGLSYTHQRVARFRDQMFYRIVAYKDYDGRMANVLAEVKANPESKLSLMELKTRLHKTNGGVK
jgi:hypothetical protein